MSLSATTQAGIVVSVVDGCRLMAGSVECFAGKGVSAHRAAIGAVAVHPTEEFAVSGDEAGAIRCWDLANPAEPRLLRPYAPHSESHAFPVLQLQVVSPTEILVSAVHTKGGYLTFTLRAKGGGWRRENEVRQAERPSG